MSNAQSEEVPFLSGMPREPEKPQQAETGCDDTLTRWRLDQLHEKIDRLTIPVRDAVQAAMSGLRSAMDARSLDQGPLDYEEPDEVRVPGIAISGGGGYKPSPDRARRNAVIDALLIAGIIALVSTSIYLLKTTVKLETSYIERGTLYDYRFRTIEGAVEQQGAELRRHDERLDRLEQQRRDAQRNADDQQGNR